MMQLKLIQREFRNTKYSPHIQDYYARSADDVIRQSGPPGHRKHLLSNTHTGVAFHHASNHNLYAEKLSYKKLCADTRYSLSRGAPT